MLVVESIGGVSWYVASTYDEGDGEAQQEDAHEAGPSSSSASGRPRRHMAGRTPLLVVVVVVGAGIVSTNGVHGLQFNRGFHTKHACIAKSVA